MNQLPILYDFPTPKSTASCHKSGQAITPPEYNATQDHIPVLVRLERVAHTQCTVRYLPDEVRFFSEVVWSHEEIPVMMCTREL